MTRPRTDAYAAEMAAAIAESAEKKRHAMELDRQAAQRLLRMDPGISTSELGRRMGMSQRKVSALLRSI